MTSTIRESAGAGDIFLYQTAAYLNHGRINYWKEKTEDEKQDLSQNDELSQNGDCFKTMRAIGWYVAGMAESFGMMISKITVFISMFFVTAGVTLNLAVLGNENEELKDRQIRCKVALLTWADSLMSIGVDFIGIVCPPAAYALHGAIENHIMKPAFIKWEIISDAESYGYDTFHNELNIRSGVKA